MQDDDSQEPKDNETLEEYIRRIAKLDEIAKFLARAEDLVYGSKGNLEVPKQDKKEDFFILD